MNLNLIYAVKSKDVNKVKELLDDKDTDVNAVDEYKFTALHYAVREELTDVVDLLLEHRAEVNVRNNSGMTPILISVMCGSLGIVEKLLKYKADPNMQDKYGYNCAHSAASNSNLTMLKLLLKYDSNIIYTKTNDGGTILHHAAVGISKKEDWSLVEWLLKQKNIDPLASDNDGQSVVDEFCMIDQSYASHYLELVELAGNSDSS